MQETERRVQVVNEGLQTRAEKSGRNGLAGACETHSLDRKGKRELSFNSRERRGRHCMIHLGEAGVGLIRGALWPTATLVPQGPHLLQEHL